MKKKTLGKLKIFDIGNFKIKDLDETEDLLSTIRRKLK